MNGEELGPLESKQNSKSDEGEPSENKKKPGRPRKKPAKKAEVLDDVN